MPPLRPVMPLERLSRKRHALPLMQQTASTSRSSSTFGAYHTQQTCTNETPIGGAALGSKAAIPHVISVVLGTLACVTYTGSSRRSG
jgi:hypothetical protein